MTSYGKEKNSENHQIMGWCRWRPQLKWQTKLHKIFAVQDVSNPPVAECQMKESDFLSLLCLISVVPLLSFEQSVIRVSCTPKSERQNLQRW